MTTYTCAKCGKLLPIVNGAPQRDACNAAITANLRAHATGSGGVK